MEMVVGSTTDGALGMLGCRSGYPARVSGVNPDVKKLHCMIHRYALCTKTCWCCGYGETLSLCELCQTWSTEYRILRLLCQQLNSEVETLLLHTSVRWLTIGQQHLEYSISEN